MGSQLRLTDRGRIEANKLIAPHTAQTLVVDESAEGLVLAREAYGVGRCVAEWPEGSQDVVPRFALSVASQHLTRDQLKAIKSRRELLASSGENSLRPLSILVLRRARFSRGNADEPWQPYAHEEAPVEARVHAGKELSLRPEWVEPVEEAGRQQQIERWWLLAEHDADAFGLGAIACRLGANERSLSWRARDLLARQVQAHLPVELARIFNLLVVHGRAIEERLFLKAADEVCGASSGPLRELVDLGLVHRLGAMVTFLPAGFSYGPESLRERLADALVSIVRGPDSELHPAAIMEAHRHLAAIPSRRADSLAFAKFGAHELVGAARALSREAAASDDEATKRSDLLGAAKLFEGVEHLAKDADERSLRAYGLHYATYNRLLARAIDRRATLSGYRRSVLLWPENGLFWVRNIKVLAVGNSYQLDDPAAARAAVTEARRAVAENYFEAYVLRRVVEDLERRYRIDLLLPLLLDTPEGPRLVARLANSEEHAVTTRRLWLPGDVRLGFHRAWNFSWASEPSRLRWTSRVDRFDLPDAECTGRGSTLLEAYASMTSSVLAMVERSLCSVGGAPSFDLDTEWMKVGASRSRWLTALYALRGIANEQARGLRRLRESVLAKLEVLGDERPSLTYDEVDDCVSLRWISPEDFQGILILRFCGEEPCDLQWIEDGTARPVPKLRNTTWRWLQALGCSESIERSSCDARLSSMLAEALREGAAVYRYRGACDSGVRDLHEREVFDRHACAKGDVFFVDPYPGHGWSHPCRYVLLGSEGPPIDVRRHWPPRSLSDWEIMRDASS